MPSDQANPVIDHPSMMDHPPMTIVDGRRVALLVPRHAVPLGRPLHHGPQLLGVLVAVTVLCLILVRILYKIARLRLYRQWGPVVYTLSGGGK